MKMFLITMSDWMPRKWMVDQYIIIILSLFSHMVIHYVTHIKHVLKMVQFKC